MSITKVAIITAASEGMGKACAVHLSSLGYKVVLMARGEAILALAKELQGVAMQGSVTKAEDIDALVALALKTYGRIDAVINNTGGPAKGNLLEISDTQWDEGMDLVLKSVIRMARAVTPIFEKQGGGAYVNISTFAAFEPDARFPVSAPMRAALGSFTKLYADMYASQNIRMNCVLPGFVDSKPIKESIVESIPMKRYAKMEEIAKTCAFLLSDAAAYITGQNIRVDGGLTSGV